MALITWNQSYSVKVKQCDIEHQKLFDLLNSLHDAMSAGKGRAILSQIVAELHHYARTHFQAEEALMNRTNYPPLPGHRLEHQRFITRVADFEQELAAGKGNAVAVLEFLRDWLAKHIKKVDQSYTTHLNAHGIH